MCHLPAHLKARHKQNTSEKWVTSAQSLGVGELSMAAYENRNDTVFEILIVMLQFKA